MKENLIFLIIYLINFIACEISTCGLGCSDCDEVNAICNQCEDGFFLDIFNNYCIF